MLVYDFVHLFACDTVFLMCLVFPSIHRGSHFSFFSSRHIFFSSLFYCIFFSLLAYLLAVPEISILTVGKDNQRARKQEFAKTLFNSLRNQRLLFIELDKKNLVVSAEKGPFSGCKVRGLVGKFCNALVNLDRDWAHPIIVKASASVQPSNQFNSLTNRTSFAADSVNTFPPFLSPTAILPPLLCTLCAIGQSASKSFLSTRLVFLDAFSRQGLDLVFPLLFLFACSDVF